MKKPLFSVITVIAFVFGAQAQNVNLGIQFTPQVSKLTYSHLSEQMEEAYREASETGLTYSLGSFVELNLSKKLSVHIGASYGQIGEKLIETYENNFQGKEKSTIDYKMHFVELPLAVKYQFNKNIFITAGTQGNYYLNSSNKVKTQYENGSTDTQKTSDKEDGVEDLNLAITGGIGFTIPIGETLSFIIQPNVVYGLTNLYESQEWDRRNLSYGLTTALNFGL